MSSVPSVGDISGYHAHVYFSAETLEQAQALCESATALFDVEMGRMHQKPVGPHPCWSCQLAFSPKIFSELVPWLALHRDGLTVLVHPQSGDDLRDHRDYAMWMGKVEVLDLSHFSK
ncbi:DOPA 4,5-dioxygenase [hydrothermal vent metagenome]|uniref:DOPA 4,5-dioxygenase n=1 Tax=hydrothermal vent metagenome TaxID=652676 RepID=A0A3B0YXQ5_9ZZZZ